MPKEQFAEILDNIRTGQTSLMCPKHFYTPSRVSSPVTGCADCWRTLYWTIYAKQPDDLRADFAEGLESTIKHMVELDSKGQWDYVPKLEISIEKE